MRIFANTHIIELPAAVNVLEHNEILKYSRYVATIFAQIEAPSDDVLV